MHAILSVFLEVFLKNNSRRVFYCFCHLITLISGTRICFKDFEFFDLMVSVSLLKYKYAVKLYICLKLIMKINSPKKEEKKNNDFCKLLIDF